MQNAPLAYFGLKSDTNLQSKPTLYVHATNGSNCFDTPINGYILTKNKCRKHVIELKSSSFCTFNMLHVVVFGG